MEWIKETQTERNMEMKISRTQKKPLRQASPKEYRKRKRSSQPLKTQQKKWVPQPEKMLNPKTPGTKHPGNLGHYEKTKLKSNRNVIGR